MTTHALPRRSVAKEGSKAKKWYQEVQKVVEAVGKWKDRRQRQRRDYAALDMGIATSQTVVDKQGGKASERSPSQTIQ
jgi:hypothetical protein